MSTLLEGSTELTGIEAGSIRSPVASSPPDSAPPTPSTGPSQPLETVLTDVETELEIALSAAGLVVKELRRAKEAASLGNCRVLVSSLARASASAEALAHRAGRARAKWSFDPATYLRDGRYAREVTVAASGAGIGVEAVGDRLVSYPSVIRLRPELGAVEIDGRREAGLRPSRIVAVLQASKDRASRFRAGPFLESLEAAYLRLISGRGGPGQIVRLVEVWELLTLLPGSAGEYSKAEFARDLNLLDESDHTRTQAGRRVRFSASSGTRTEGTLTAVGHDGRPILFWGVCFS